MGLREIALSLRRQLGAAKHFVGELPIHFARRGPCYPALPKRLVEQALLLVSNGITAGDYYYLRLYRAIDWREKRQYLGHFRLSRLYACLNSPAHKAMVADKRLFHLLCVANDLPVMPILALYSERAKEGPWVPLSDLNALKVFLLDPTTEHVFLKPSSEQRGAGALALGSRIGAEAWESLPSGAAFTVDDVVRHVTSYRRDFTWIMQRLARPHPAMAEVIPRVCSTVRMITLNEGTPRLIGAIVRFGDGDSPADNSNGSGIVAHVDLETGVLSTAMYAEDGDPKFDDCHPRTGVRIAGRVLPDWDAIKRITLAGAARFTGLNCIGWDVGITDCGPVIIEANSQSGFLSMQNLTNEGFLKGPFGDALRPHSGIAKSGIRVPAKTVSGPGQMEKAGIGQTS